VNICDTIESIRPVGKVTCGSYHGSQIIDRKNRIKNLGFRPIPDVFWVELNRSEVTELLVRSLSCHIEDDERILDEDNVKPIVIGFIEMFEKDEKFFSNATSGFECISTSFLDVAVLVENEKGVVGFVCIEDDQSP
jgi:hypothetical protein